jgi:hypothetical protein
MELQLRSSVRLRGAVTNIGTPKAHHLRICIQATSMQNFKDVSDHDAPKGLE